MEKEAVTSGVKAAIDFIRELNENPDDRALAEASEQELIAKKKLADEAYQKGFDKGRLEGKANGKDEASKEAAIAMLHAGEPRKKNTVV